MSPRVMNETTLTSGTLVLQTTSPYRTIAQKHWGLTKEQMKGMHVHHRIPQSEGGTNDPSNLYVCSPWFHYNVWHNGANSLKITLAASCGGKANTLAQKQQRQRVAQSMYDAAANLRGRIKSIETRRTPLKLTCISTREEFYFSSQAEACKAFKLSKGCLNGVLNGNRAKHKGFVAEYVKPPKLRHVN